MIFQSCLIFTTFKAFTQLHWFYVTGILTVFIKLNWTISSYYLQEDHSPQVAFSLWTTVRSPRRPPPTQKPSIAPQNLQKGPKAAILRPNPPKQLFVWTNVLLTNLILKFLSRQQFFSSLRIPPPSYCFHSAYVTICVSHQDLGKKVWTFNQHSMAFQPRRTLSSPSHYFPKGSFFPVRWLPNCTQLCLNGSSTWGLSAAHYPPSLLCSSTCYLHKFPPPLGAFHGTLAYTDFSISEIPSTMNLGVWLHRNLLSFQTDCKFMVWTACNILILYHFHFIWIKKFMFVIKFS